MNSMSEIVSENEEIINKIDDVLKAESVGNARNNVFGTTKFTNLNFDCMETIFEYLDLNDLLNVADSNKHFYNSVCKVFQRKYRNLLPIFVDKATW